MQVTEGKKEIEQGLVLIIYDATMPRLTRGRLHCGRWLEVGDRHHQRTSSHNSEGAAPMHQGTSRSLLKCEKHQKRTKVSQK
jgi:hypothetical protein